MKSFAILGRQPKIGFAELESLYGTANIEPFSATCCTLNSALSYRDCQRLGSVIKVGQVITVEHYTNWRILSDQIVSTFKKIAQDKPDGKLQIGISVYGLNIHGKDIEITGLKVKKTLKASGRSIRLVPNKNDHLSTAQVLHNKLDGRSGIEIVVIANGSKVLIGQTIHEQDINAYTARDQARPKRDAYIGMLPPKLGQTIINLASRQINTTETLLDPFCGTGVILQEALIMGFDVIGTDINPKMIDYSVKNIAWIKNEYRRIANQKADIQLGDATVYEWPNNVTVIAGETYLGQPISMMPDTEKLTRLINETNGLHKKTLENLAKQLKPGARLCLAVPAWRTKNGFKHLPTLDQLDEIGYNRIEFKYAKNRELIYIRDDQFVGRELVVLTRK